jgi:quinol monooxygenase YgiN
MSDAPPTTIVVHFYAKPGHGAELRHFIMPAIPRLTELPGCRGGSLYHDIDTPDVCVLIEHWDSVEAHKAYIHKVETDGTMERMGPLLDRPPERRYLTPI